MHQFVAIQKLMILTVLVVHWLQWLAVQLASSFEDHEFNLWSCQTKDYKTGFCYLISAKYTIL
jgi:hypothetical protein